MSTKMITSGQKEAGVSVIVAAARKAGTEAIEELSENGVLNSGNFQRGVLAQGNRINAVVKVAVKTALAELADNIVGRLKRLFLDRTIELAETDGKETIAEAKDVFTGGIYYYAKERRTRCTATKKTVVTVYEMIKDGTYAQVFGGFGENLRRLCWTESQIVALCRDHRDLFRKDGYGTFFLFEGENGGFLVAHVRVSGDGRLLVLVFPLGEGSVWHAVCQYRISVLQL
jgi:hypothetical protein